ncbi:MAG: glycosyltransferase [Candidatus Latescibacteria bacterium]|nr:glycosyltransferase [Candidatus Latescibacterota bacterium]
MTLLSVVESLVLAGWMCIVLYGLFLCIANWVKRRQEAPLIQPRHVFAVVIPTTNAERLIGRALDRLTKTILYPSGMFDLIVVPVNCTDRTTAIAREKGATVYGPGKRRWRDRNDAIQSALERLASKKRYDAYLMLDTRADVSPEILAVLSDRLSKGAKIIQTGYRFAGSSKSWKAAAASVLHALSPTPFTPWSSILKWATGIRRLGFCLSKEVVERFGVRSPSITDGHAYTTKLLHDDVAVVYAAEAVVYDHGYATPPIRSFRRQIEIRLRMLRNDALRLIKEGREWDSIAQISGGINLLMPSLTVLLGGAFFFLCLSAMLHGATLNPLEADSFLLLGWEILIAGILVMVLGRMALIGSPFLAYVGLPAMPFYVLWRSFKSWRWERSRRSSKAVPARAQSAQHSEKGTSSRRRPPHRRRVKQQSSN